MSKTALYLRLSKEDKFSSESESIISQRIYLMQYASDNGMSIDIEFIDDGISGTIWERAGLQAMLAAIQAGEIQTILVKDLSRLSRDYIHTGELLERWFPAHHVRLIAVSDHFDSATESSANNFSPVQAIMNDWYARDISQKVRGAIYARQSAGLCTISAVPYGYIRANGQLEVVQTQAAIIKYIFHECLNGKNCLQIAHRLNQLSICTPSGKGAWSDTSIRRIMKNPVYIGNLLLHTTRRISYKCRIKQILPKSEAIIFHVPPIIQTEEFAQAQSKLNTSAHTASTKHWLSGKVKCGICGANMVIVKEKDNFRLICSNRKHKCSCKNPSYRYDKLCNQLNWTMADVGFQGEVHLFRMAIQQIVIFEQQIDLFLRTSRPKQLNTM